jgi:hypothetical protein
MIHSSENERFLTRWTIPVALFLSSLLLVTATVKDYGVTWDEPPYFHASDLHIGWTMEFGNNVAAGKFRESLADQKIKAAWHWNPYNVPHPPFSRIISGLTKHLFSPRLDKFSAYRIGPALFFAALVTAMYLWMKELFGRATALFSVVALIAIPNLFGFAHIAVTDLPLASMWFLTVYCFWKGLKNWKWSAMLGVVWGLALATKFPALLLPVPLLLWAHLFHRDKYANNVFAMLFLAPIVMIATQPYLWHQPGPRILEFLYEGISRAYRPETNYTIFFLNEFYFTNQLPWYYPFFAAAVTTPEAILGLALVGVVSIPWLQERRPAIVLFLANAAFVLIMGALPGAVLHDGVRQLLSALPFLAALAGSGFAVLLQAVTQLSERLKPLKEISYASSKATFALVVLLLFTPVLDTYLSHPFQLSYYNRLVGGIGGAYARGLEVTYFMEAFTPDLLRALNEKVPKNSTINASFANFMFEYYQNEGRLRSDISFTTKGSSDYYLILNRQSTLPSFERVLLRSAKPTLIIDIAGVPLVALIATPR